MSEIILNDELLKEALVIYQKHYFTQKTFNEDEFNTSKAFDKKMKKIIKSENSVYHRLTLTHIRKVICIAAAILILLLSLLSVGAVREAIACFFVMDSANNVDMYTFFISDINGQYPQKIEKHYEITFIPEGFEFYERDPATISSSFTYKDKYNSRIEFSQYTKEMFDGSFDITEYIKYRKQEYNGKTYLYIKYDCGYRSIFWDDGEYLFQVFTDTVPTDLSEDALFKICDSVKLKKE